MFYSWPFSDVDFLLFPMFMPKAKHWLLGVINLKEMTLTIYNSLRSLRFKEEIGEVSKAMATTFPHLLASVGHFNGHPELYFSSQYQRVEPLEILIPELSVQQENGYFFLISFVCFIYVFIFLFFFLFSFCGTVSLFSILFFLFIYLFFWLQQ